MFVCTAISLFSDKSVTEVCTDDHFVCWDRNSCIPFNKTCDGRSDCKDASDEGIDYCCKSCFVVTGKGAEHPGYIQMLLCPAELWWAVYICDN